MLDVLGFDSERKRMSMVVRSGTDLVLYCKGADSTLLPLIDDRFANSTRGARLLHIANVHLSLYASLGLRTLCLAMKRLSESDYRQWKAVSYATYT